MLVILKKNYYLFVYIIAGKLLLLSINCVIFYNGGGGFSWVSLELILTIFWLNVMKIPKPEARWILNFYGVLEISLELIQNSRVGEV